MNKIIEVAKELFDGVSEDQMSHLKDISSYNYNFYQYKGKLLLGISDDDNFTQWYWARGNQFHPIAGSYCSDGDFLIVDYAYT